MMYKVTACLVNLIYILLGFAISPERSEIGRIVMACFGALMILNT